MDRTSRHPRGFGPSYRDQAAFLSRQDPRHRVRSDQSILVPGMPPLLPERAAQHGRRVAVKSLTDHRSSGTPRVTRSCVNLARTFSPLVRRTALRASVAALTTVTTTRTRGCSRAPTIQYYFGRESGREPVVNRAVLIRSWDSDVPFTDARAQTRETEYFFSPLHQHGAAPEIPASI